MASSEIDIFLQYLRQIALDIPVGFLSSRDRFKLLVTALMGNPRIRGYQKNKEESWADAGRAG